MKKSLLMLCLGLSTMLIFVGCNNTETVEEEPFVEEEVFEQEEVVETEEEETEFDEVAFDLETETVAEEEEANGDPELAALEVTQEFAQENSLICLKRNGVLYGLNGITPENCKEYNLGWIYYPITNTDALPVGELNHYLDDVYFEGENKRKGSRFMTAGDLPEITLEEGDELLWFYDSDTLKVFSAEKVGYSPEIVYTDSYDGFADYGYNDKREHPYVFDLSDLKDFSLTNKDGVEVTSDSDDFFYSLGARTFNSDAENLIEFEYRKEYCIYCISGFDEYYWSIGKANCTVYDVIGLTGGGMIMANFTPPYELQGSIDTVNKCYSYDYSELESGLYYIGDYIVNVE